jgi:hypothetical protein
MHFLRHAQNCLMLEVCTCWWEGKPPPLVSVPPFAFRWRYHSPIPLSLSGWQFVITLFLLQQTMYCSSLFLYQTHHKTVQARRSIYPHTKQLDTFDFSRSDVLAAVSHPWRPKFSRMWHCVAGWAVIRNLKDHSAFIVKVKQFTSTLSGLLHSADKRHLKCCNILTQQRSVTIQKIQVLSLHFLVNRRTSWWGGVRSEAQFTQCVCT